MQNVCRWYGDQVGNQPGSARRRSFLTAQPAPADPARGRGGPAEHTGVADRWALRVGRNKGSTYTLVFNRRTYQLPSMNWTGRLGLNGASRGEVLVKLAIVNGQASYPDLQLSWYPGAICARSALGSLHFFGWPAGIAGIGQR